MKTEDRSQCVRREDMNVCVIIIKKTKWQPDKVAITRALELLKCG